MHIHVLDTWPVFFFIAVSRVWGSVCARAPSFLVVGFWGFLAEQKGAVGFKARGLGLSGV